MLIYVLNWKSVHIFFNFQNSSKDRNISAKFLYTKSELSQEKEIETFPL